MTSPADLGAPARFTSWRRGQDVAFDRLLSSQKRFFVAALPVGIGKTLNAVLYPIVMDWRAMALTSTKGLEDQYAAEWAEKGLVDVRGMANYPCVMLRSGGMCDEGPCLDGVECVYLKAPGCHYFDARRRATAAKLVASNYAQWFTDFRTERSLGHRDLLICDEAHDVPQVLTSHVGCTFKEEEVTFPPHAASMQLDDWRHWAHTQFAKTELAMLGPLSSSDKRKLRALRFRLQRLMKAGEDWVIDERDDSFAFEPLWPADYAEEWLFQGIHKVLLTSATIKRKTLEHLGLTPDDYDFCEVDSPFDPLRRPIVHVSCVRVNFDISDSQRAQWITTIDQILQGRRDRKGIIHCVAYKHANTILEMSAHRDRIISHVRAGGIQQAVQRFKKAGPGAVLLSPSVHTGYDFKYKDAEYQIIAKVPFMDTRRGINAARQASDKEWRPYNAVLTLEQMVGRPMRADDDRGETLIVDDTIKYLTWSHGGFFSKWWREAYRDSPFIPAPPPLL